MKSSSTGTIVTSKTRCSICNGLIYNWDSFEHTGDHYCNCDKSFNPYDARFDRVIRLLENQYQKKLSSEEKQIIKNILEA